MVSLIFFIFFICNIFNDFLNSGILSSDFFYMDK